MIKTQRIKNFLFNLLLDWVIPVTVLGLSAYLVCFLVFAERFLYYEDHALWLKLFKFF